MSEVRTESGLVVPESAVRKTKRTLLPDRLKKIGRFLADMRAEGIRVVLACAACGEAMQATSQNRLVEEDHRGGDVVFTCKCSVRHVRR